MPRWRPSPWREDELFWESMRPGSRGNVHPRPLVPPVLEFFGLLLAVLFKLPRAIFRAVRRRRRR